MNNVQAILNFNNFANNFSKPLLNKCFQVCNRPEHLEQKFNSLKDSCNNNGTFMFFRWFSYLDRENSIKVATFINEHYNK